MFHNVKHAVHLCSRSPHGERGLKCGLHRRIRRGSGCRSPHGERGLKCARRRHPDRHHQSLSSRRAWIEISNGSRLFTFISRSPHGERGLKYRRHPTGHHLQGRSPHGERGLKFEPSDWTDVNDSRSPHGERGLKF